MAFTNEHLTRQMDLVPSKILSTPIFIVGAGAIGGLTALSLAKMGYRYITVWDDDEVSVENMSSQFYRFKDIGKNKVAALQHHVEDFTGLKLSVRDERFCERSAPQHGVVIAAVDSMAARKLIWEKHKENLPTTLFIDPRMGAETAMLFSMKPLDERDATTYEKSLYTDDSALHEPCTAKATMYCALMLSGLVAMTVTKFLAGERYARTAQWSVKDNHLIAWDQEGNRFGG